MAFMTPQTFRIGVPIAIGVTKLVMLFKNTVNGAQAEQKRAYASTTQNWVHFANVTSKRF